jgi:hypothetical protein
MLNLQLRVLGELSERVLVVDVDVLIGLMVDDFSGNVEERDVMSLCNVEDGVAGTVGEPSHADVQRVITGLHVINGELGKEVNCIGGREQSKIDLLRPHLRILLPERSNDLEPELHDGDEAQGGALMVLFNFSSDNVESSLDQVGEVFGAKRSGVGLKCLIVLEMMSFVVDHPGWLLILLF